MTRYAINITTNGATYICDVIKKRDFRTWDAGVIAAGAFGGGTITMGISPDNGVTIVPMMDAAGVPITSTANDDFTLTFGGTAKNNDHAKIYATMAGSTAPNVNLYLYDNNG